MSKFPTAYDTSATQGFVALPKIKAAIERAQALESFMQTNPSRSGSGMGEHKVAGILPTLVTTITEGEALVPLFSHPMLVTLGRDRFMVSDARMFMRKEGLNGKGDVSVMNQTEYDFTVLRTQLSALWAGGETNQFKFAAKVPVAVYAKWLSQNIAARFGLDGLAQNTVSVIAAYFYLSLFSDQESIPMEERYAMVPTIAKAAMGEKAWMAQVVEQIDVCNDIASFCQTVKAILEDPRLDDLTPVVLVTMLSTSWFGTNGREIAATAIEHVPTFFTMLHFAFEDKTYKKSRFTSLTDNYKGMKGQNEFAGWLSRVRADILSGDF